MKYVLVILPAMIIIVLIVLLTCQNQTSEIISIKADHAATLAISNKLDKTIDSFTVVKPILNKAIEKIKHQDSLITELQKPVIADSSELKRIRLDLYEARQEIKRLCEPKEIQFYKFKN